MASMMCILCAHIHVFLLPANLAPCFWRPQHLPETLQILARKMVATFKLCSEQLSSQDHYDYGMRAVKSTITACGNLKGGYPDDPEDALVLRGLRDINVPKFLAPDLPLFHGIISDLFPGVPPPDVDYSALKGALADACAASTPALQPVPQFIDKAIQLYETTLVRHGLMLVGGPMAGKSCAYRSLAAAMTALSGREVPGAKFPPVRITALNPKAVTMGQLYGEFDPNTHEWTDGVLACHMRTAAEDTSSAVKWLMFDGYGTGAEGQAAAHQVLFASVTLAYLECVVTLGLGLSAVLHCFDGSAKGAVVTGMGVWR